MTAPTNTSPGLALGFGEFQQAMRAALVRSPDPAASRFGGIEITMNVDDMLGELNDAAREQLPFAMAQAINMTVEDAQQAVRDRILMRGFTMRSANSARWLTNQVKFYRGDRATKYKLEAALTVEGGAGFGQRDPGSSVGRSLLAFLEEGGTRQGVRPIGDGSVFGPSIVVPARTSPMDQIPRSLYPANLGLSPRRAIEGGWTRAHGGKWSLRGARRTFVVRTAAAQGIVLQRFGKGRAGVRALFFIRPRVQVRGRHFFYPVVQQVVQERFGYNFGLAFAEAARTAKPKRTGA